MNPAVRRLLEHREAEGFGRHVEDDATLAQVAHLLDANDTNTNNGSHGVQELDGEFPSQAPCAPVGGA